MKTAVIFVKNFVEKFRKVRQAPEIAEPQAAITHQPPVKQATPQPHLQDPRYSIAPQPSMACLPPNVLSHIFMFYMAFLDEPLSITVPAHGLFCLAQVCSRWRAIAESTPHLWSSIYIFIPNKFKDYKNGEKRVALVFDFYLERSGALPISLTYIDLDRYNCQEELVPLLVDRLRTHSRRWKRISLDLSNPYFPHLLTFTPCDLSSLEHLRIHATYLFRERDRLDLGCVPNLTSFAYTMASSPLEIVNLCWEQLEEVSLQLGHDTSSRDLECLAQNITTCSMPAYSWRTDWGDLITLPRLRTLHVKCGKYVTSNMEQIAAFLILPQLQTLEIGLETTSPQAIQLFEETQFPELLKRSECSLRHLSIEDVNLSSDVILDCLRLSDALLSFRYIPDPLSQDAFADVVCRLKTLPLIVKDQKQIRKPLVPALQEITLGTSVKTYMDTMIAVFRSRGGARARAAGVTPLRHARAVFLRAKHGNAHSLTEPSTEALYLQMKLAEWVSTLEDEKKNSGEVVGERLQTSVEAFAVCESSGRRYRYPSAIIQSA